MEVADEADGQAGQAAVLGAAERAAVRGKEMAKEAEARMADRLRERGVQTPPPGDPLVEARARRLEEAGRSAFNDYFLPEAAVALKQGAGRLIRRESDRGILVVGDARLRSMGYGRRLLAALPPMRVLAGPADYAEALDALASVVALPLTTASTTDPDWP